VIRKPFPPTHPPTAGLCGNCVHQKLVHNTRGSTFSMCLRHRTEPERYPKYPPLPVRACAGHEPRGDHSTVSGSASTR
jgi:hypothetical protein